jgi:hypothetical protein
VILGSYILCIAILVKYIARIVGWFSFKKNTIVVILFVFALGSVMVNAIIAMIDTSLRLGYRPSETKLILGGSVDVSKGRFNTLDSMYFLSFVFSFVSAWIATAALLVYYSTRVGKFKYWLITIAPLLFFLGQFVAFFAKIFSPLINLDSFFLATLITLVATLSKPLGGLMLGIAFWSMARLGEQKTSVQNYLTISGLGLLLLFTSNQALLMAISPYPPFGLSTITVLGLSAYLTVVGIYSSSVTVSHNAELRKSLRKLASSELLNSLASAEMERQIGERVSKIVRTESVEMENQTGISSSMTEGEAKEYIEKILHELKKK